MYLVMATFITMTILINNSFESLWVIPVMILAGVIFPPIHFKLINDTQDAPVGVVFLSLAFAATLGFAMPHIFSEVMQVALLFLAGTLFYTDIKKAIIRVKV